MTPDKIVHDAAETVLNLLAAITPPAIGSAVAQAFKAGLSWRARFEQWVVGICVSYYATLAITSCWSFDKFVGQSLGFTIGLIAFEATPKLRDRALALVSTLADAAADWISRRLGVTK